jgi:hypothetical protein
MTLPGYKVTIGERLAAPTAAPAASNGFMVGFSERGSVTKPILVTSLTDAAQKLGGRVSGKSVLYDSLDAAFREGASHIYVSRIFSSLLKAATVKAEDAGAKKVLKIDAITPGTWGNNLKVKITNAGEKVTLVVEESSVVVETSPQFSTIEEIVEWATANSAYLVIAKEETGVMPKTATLTLATGADDYEATDPEIEAAINRFPRDLGPGQIAAPGFTTEALQEALLKHAGENNRRALCDATDTAESATIVSQATSLRDAPNKAARFGALLAPWVRIPGLTLGTFRTIPYSGVQMGLIARAEAEGATPNQAAAGKRGRCRYAVEPTQVYSNAAREAMNDAGATVAVAINGVVTTYGDKTVTNSITDGNWDSFAGSRLIMGVAALAERVLENYVFEQIDGRGLIFKQLEGDLSGLACMPFYLANSLYGTTPAEAFNVNTGPDVNTPSSIAKGEIKAQIAVRTSPLGEMLSVEIVKVPTTENL